MLRGVNKRIIEISDTGSDVFEKALFFIKDNNGLSQSELKKEAHRMVVSYFSEENRTHSGFLRYTDNRKKRQRKILVISLLSVLCCVAVAVLVKIIM